MHFKEPKKEKIFSKYLPRSNFTFFSLMSSFQNSISHIFEYNFRARRESGKTWYSRR